MSFDGGIFEGSWPPSPAPIITWRRSSTMRWFWLIGGCSGIFASHNPVLRTRCVPAFSDLAQKSFAFFFFFFLGSRHALVPHRRANPNQPFLQTDAQWLAVFPFEGMMSCVWLPSKRVREALLGSRRCHSPVQCCLNMIRQGSTVKRLKA